MKRTLFAVAATAALGTGIGIAEAAQPPKFGKLDHVFVIIMENQTDTDIVGNTNAPFINSYRNVANEATNYFAVGHPSAPNYLEIVGGSNFGVSNDYWPKWVNGGCVDNSPGSTGCVNAVTPIAVAGLDNPVVQRQPSHDRHPGRELRATTPTFTPKSIADQLVANKQTWKTYQESLPSVVPGIDGINYSDGEFSNLSPGRGLRAGPHSKSLCCEA